MNGLKFAANGFVGRAPTMSGYSCGGFALSIVDILQKIQKITRKAQARTLSNSRLRHLGRLALSKGEGWVRVIGIE